MGDYIKLLDKSATKYVLENPWIMELYSILRVAYNDDGTKKDLKKVLIEREELLNDEQKMLSKKLETKDVTVLYQIIINERYFNVDEELGIITDYIHETKQIDEFSYNILKYRLNKEGFSKENQDLLIGSIQNYVAENGKSNVK